MIEPARTISRTAIRLRHGCESLRTLRDAESPVEDSLDRRFLFSDKIYPFAPALIVAELTAPLSTPYFFKILM
jgi:hypothetical protein